MSYQPSTIRLLKTDTVPTGTGILIAPGYLLTCTHCVVQAQGGGDRDAADMGRAVSFDMPLLPTPTGGGPLRALPLRCEPPLDNPRIDDPTDIAVLRIAEPERLPEGARPAVLTPDPQTFDRDAIAFGFERWKGDLVRLTLLGMDTTGAVELEQRPGYPEVGRGFSGAAVLDPATGAAFGMLVRRDQGKHPRKAYMIPAAKLLAVLDEAGIGPSGNAVHEPDPEPPSQRLLWQETVRLLTECLGGDATANAALCSAAFFGHDKNPTALLQMNGPPNGLATAWTSTLWEAKCIEGRSPLSLLLEAGYQSRRAPAVDGLRDFQALLDALDSPCADGG